MQPSPSLSLIARANTACPRGFALIELVIVLIIFSALTFVGIRFLPSTTLQSDAIARAFSGAIRYTQTLCLARQRAFTVSVDTNGYAIHSPLTNDHSFVQTNVSLPSGFSLSPIGSIAFDGKGALSSTESTFTLRYHGTAEKTITIYPETGLVICN